jgi:hypothetical protein
MRAKVKSSTASCLLSGVVAVWLCASGSVLAGDGANLAAIQAIIGPPNGSSGFCSILNMNPCPQLPTVTQALLEAASLGLSPPEMVAAQNEIAPGGNVYAGNPTFPPTPFPLNATTSPTLSKLLATLAPLAFENALYSGSTATATQLYDADVDTYLYAVAVSTSGINLSTRYSADTLYLFYDDLKRTNPNFLRGQTVAKFLFPLTVLNSDGTERAVPTILQLIAPITDCSASTVTGNFLGLASGNTQVVPAADIGLKCAVVFGPSPTSAERHAIFELAIPLVVTGANPPPLNTDPAYFYFLHHAAKGPINTGLYTTFLNNDLGFTPTMPGILPSGASIGIAPTAAPLGPPPSCMGTNCTPPPSTFALCASLPQNGFGLITRLVPAVGAYYAISTAGETFLSTAIPGVSTSQCPKL